MTTWTHVGATDPELSHRVRALVEARQHHTVATLRADALAAVDARRHP